MIVKKHVASGKLVVVVCDSSLIGKRLEEGKLQLDLSSDFFKGKKINDTDIIDLVKRAYIVNVTGVKSIEFFIKNKILSQSNMIKISDVPHAEILIGNEL